MGINNSLESKMPARSTVLSPKMSDLLCNVFVGDQKVYRGITSDEHELYERLFSLGIIEKLAVKGVIPPTRRSDKFSLGFAMVIEHDISISPLRFHELSPSMLKQMALVCVELSELLDEAGLRLNHLSYAHFVFDPCGRPYFMALGEITEKGLQKFPFFEFAKYFFGPLTIMARRPELADFVRRGGSLGMDELLTIMKPFFMGFLRSLKQFAPTRKISIKIRQKLQLSPFSGLVAVGDYFNLLRFAGKEFVSRRLHGKEAEAIWTMMLLKKLKKQIKSFDMSRIEDRWSSYHDGYSINDVVNSKDGWQKYYESERSQQIMDLLSRENPSTLLDLGANQGYFSLLAARLGFRATALDHDSGAVDKLYCALLEHNFQIKVAPGVVDFMDLKRDEWTRFAADVTLALGFTHHMRLVELLPWSHIAEVLAGVTKRMLITEFKPDTRARAAHVEVKGSLREDYQLENFISALKCYFQSVEIVGTFAQHKGGGQRQLLVCRK